MNSRPSLAQYYLTFKSVLGIVAVAISAVPLLSKALPSPEDGYGFPPLGDAEVPARIGAFVIGLAATFFAFFSATDSASKNRKLITGAIVSIAVCLFIYVALFSRFVRKVEISSLRTSVQVTVGFHRTDSALATFDGETDWEMLRHRGTDDEQLEWLWTSRSLLIARLSLFITYCVFIFSVVAAFSWGVLEDSRNRVTPNDIE
jgi:hypothetical protein